MLIGGLTSPSYQCTRKSKKEMVAGGVARQNSSKHWYSKEVLVVEEQEECGLASEYEII